MIQSNASSGFTLCAQLSAQPVADSPTASAYQAVAGWIDDEFALITFGY